MVAFPSFEVDDMAEFTGRPEFTFPEHVDEALQQSLFFIQARTKITEWPDDPQLQQAFTYAILDLANQMYLERQYDRVKANPFSSETIGSYSYSKSNAASAALYSAIPTGIMWLDLLLALLQERVDAAAGLRTHGSTHVFEWDDVSIIGGQRWVIGPANQPEEPDYPHSPYPIRPPHV